MSVSYQPVDNIFQEEHESTPGAGQFLEDQSGKVTSLAFICPCGCGRTRCIQVSEPLNGSHGRRIWGWNGDREKPTVRPSILDVGSCEYHGWLTDGQFTKC